VERVAHHLGIRVELVQRDDVAEGDRPQVQPLGLDAIDHVPFGRARSGEVR
jgi:hypothetical protein